MSFPLIVDDVTDSGGNFVLVGATWGGALGGYLNHLAFVQQTTGAGAQTANFTFLTLTAGSAYAVSLTWTELSNRGTDVSWKLYDSNGTTVLYSGTINQQVAPTANVTTGGRPFQTIVAAAVPTGTSLKLVLDNHGSDATKFIIADAAYIDVVPGQTVSPTGIASAEAFGTVVVTTGPITITPTGIASAEAFGTATITVAPASGPALATQFVGPFGYSFFFPAPAGGVGGGETAGRHGIGLRIGIGL